MTLENPKLTYNWLLPVGVIIVQNTAENAASDGFGSNFSGVLAAPPVGGLLVYFEVGSRNCSRNLIVA